MKVLSLGAGVQSSTLAMMSTKGVINKLDCAIFADTLNEPRNVYEWLEQLKKMVDFPIYTVKKGDLMADAVERRVSKRSGNTYMRGIIPAFTLEIDENGKPKKGLLGRKCTSDYKIVPIQRKVKELLGIKRNSKTEKRQAEMWIGISIDEAHRMKPSRVNFIKNIHPLIDMGMSRNDCLKWMNDNDFPIPPRSSCQACPFHGDAEWLRLKLETPKDFYKAVEIEKKLQQNARGTVLRGVPYLHSSCQPLDQIDFNNNKGYQQLDLFGNECEGLCGV